MEDHLAEFERALRRRGYRPNTIKTYRRFATRFLQDLDVPLERVGREDVLRHLDTLTQQGVAPRARKVALAALRLLLEEVIGSDSATAGIRRARVPKRAPVIPSPMDHLGTARARKLG